MNKIKVYPLRQSNDYYWTENRPYVFDVPEHPKFFQKIVLWLLNKVCKPTPIQSYEDIPLVELDPNDIVHCVYNQNQSIEQVLKTTPKYLLLGRKAMQDLKMRMVYGVANIDDKFGDNPVAKRFGGLKVIFVPWMEGVLVLPDFDREP